MGKQLWRLATNTKSLVSRLYKSRYFDKTDVIHAGLGHNPSFIWRSLMEAQQLIRDGVRWRMGNEKSIQILDQPWLLTEQNPYIMTDTIGLQGKTVDSSICTDKLEWDVEVVSDIFNNRDKDSILAIPLSTSDQEVQLYWKFEEFGLYSVKSAYRRLQDQRSHWSVEPNDKVWQILWCIKAPPKVINLVWTRNDLVWNQKHTRIYRTVAAARQYLAQWITTQDRNFVTPLQPKIDGDGAVTWVKPQPNKVKISVDAAVFDDHGGVGFGLVARNSAGELCEAKAVFQRRLYSPVEAEAMAFKEALSWMDRRG
ncbi:uncharacterized protein LOC141716720 [Apium graveolens]|uniref:uncharacterized protein LOC141716720 n=1 Tax=Apium graveolens TaxID=4045 RepID=UPI003D7AACED